MRKRIRRRKCCHCKQLYLPDYRNAHKQKYCSRPECSKASKVAAQARWFAKENNRDYFSGPANVERVRQWRKRNPGYHQKKTDIKKSALQDYSNAKRTVQQEDNRQLAAGPLQDYCNVELAVLVGLISKVTGSTLQDDIVKTTRHLQQLGDDILNPFTPDPLQGGQHADKNSASPRPSP